MMTRPICPHLDHPRDLTAVFLVVQLVRGTTPDGSAKKHCDRQDSVPNISLAYLSQHKLATLNCTWIPLSIIMIASESCGNRTRMTVGLCLRLWIPSVERFCRLFWYVTRLMSYAGNSPAILIRRSLLTAEQSFGDGERISIPLIIRHCSTSTRTTSSSPQKLILSHGLLVDVSSSANKGRA